MVRMIRFMLQNTYVNVSFGKWQGKNWKVGNGVRQGGILSPYLFNLYINEVLEKISGCGTYRL